MKREVGSIIERFMSSDFNCLVTVTGVNTSPDLRHASVYISVYGEQADAKVVIQLLQSKRIDIQSILSKNVRLKYTPVLHFKLDDQLEKADRIYKILDNLKTEDDHEASDAK